MSNIQLKMGQSNPNHNYLLHYSYEVPDPSGEDGDNWNYNGEISTYILSDLFKDACDEVEDSTSMYPQTNIFDEILKNALDCSGEDTSDWENIEFNSATPFDKRKRSWG